MTCHAIFSCSASSSYVFFIFQPASYFLKKFLFFPILLLSAWKQFKIFEIKLSVTVKKFYKKTETIMSRIPNLVDLFSPETLA